MVLAEKRMYAKIRRTVALVGRAEILTRDAHGMAKDLDLSEVARRLDAASDKLTEAYSELMRALGY